VGRTMRKWALCIGLIAGAIAYAQISDVRGLRKWIDSFDAYKADIRALDSVHVRVSCAAFSKL